MSQGSTSGRPVTLREALERAEEASPLLGPARARIGLADAAIEGARPLLRDNPDAEIGFGPRLGAAGAHLDGRARVEQRIEVFGQRDARMDAAQRLRALEETRLDATRLVVRVAVGQAFFEALLARERAAATREAEAVQARVVEIARARLRAGDIGALGVRIAEADLAQATQARLEADAVKVALALRLAAAAGLGEEPIPRPAGDLPEAVGPAPLQVLLARAASAQPARRVAAAEVAEREGRRVVAAAEGWPTPAFGIEYGLEEGPQSIALATLAVPIPLFQRNQGASAQAKAERDIARAELTALDQARPARVRALFASAEAAAARIGIFRREVLPRFRENLELIRRAFELGEIDALDVSAARARMVEAQRSAIEAYRDYFGAMAELAVETGIEWPERTQP